MSKQVLFARLTKVDEASRMVFGRAIQSVVDNAGERFNYEKSKPHFEKWSTDQAKATEGKSLGNLRAMHGKVAAGVLKKIDFQDTEQAIDIGAHVVDDGEWKKVLAGVYTGFSVGGSYGDYKEVIKVDGKDVTDYEAIPSEISLVDRPCVPTATFFEVQKADGTMAKVEFAKPTEPEAPKEAPKPTRADMVKFMQDNGAKPEDLLAMDDATLTKACGDKAAELTKARRTEQEAALVKAGHKAEDLAKLDDAKVAELHKALPPEDVVYEVAGSDADVQALYKLMTERKLSVNDVVVLVTKADAPRELAKIFADEDSKLYPLNSAAQVKAAWAFIHKIDPARYDEAKLAKVKGRIAEAYEKVVGTKPVAPTVEELKKSLTTGELRKGMWRVADLANLIQCLLNITCNVEYEQFAEGDTDSQLPARLTNAIADLGEILKVMIDEELKEELAGEHHDYLTRADGLLTDLKKRLNPGHLAKRAPLTPSPAAAPQGTEELTKALKASQDALTNVTGELAKVQGRVSELEKAAAQPQRRVVLKAIAKGDDVVTDDGKTKQVAPVTKADGTTNEVATGIKEVHKGGGQRIEKL